ncbi:MAG: extracellular solute-binding protein, partial [Thermomicrobiales bacterium]
MSTGRIANRRLSRRALLGGAAGVTLGATLAGPGRVARAAPLAQEITIPDSGATLPDDDVTLRWMDSGDLKALFEQPVFAAYQEAHPNITIQYDGVPWDVIGETVPLGIRNGSAPDVFAMPLNIPTAQAVAEEWV